MNTYIEALQNDDVFKRETLSLETLDNMMISEVMGYDDIALEGDLFGQVKITMGKIANFFKNIFKYIAEFINVSDMLSKFWDTDAKKNVAKEHKAFDKNTKGLEYSDVSDVEIPVSIGLRTKVVPLTDALNDNAAKYVKDYSEFIIDADKSISEFLTQEDTRITFSKNKPNTKFIKTVKDTDGMIMDRLNRKQKGSLATIDEVYGSIKSVKDSLENTIEIYNQIPEKTFKDNVNKIRGLKDKIESIYELIEVEKEPVSKESIKSLIGLLELLADSTTVLGKIGLTLYEVSIMNVSTCNILTKLNNK